MRPSRVTCVASIIIRPAPLYARWPRWMRCQSFIEPSSAEYWHIGEMTMRLGSVMPPSWNGVKSSGCANGDSLFGKDFSQVLREYDGVGLVAVQAQGIGRHRNALAGEARHVATPDPAQHLRFRQLRI